MKTAPAPSPDRLVAVDLRDLAEAELALLRQEAIRQGISFTEYLGQLVAEKSAALVARVTPKNAA